MRRTNLLFLIILLSCSSTESPIDKVWLGRTIDFASIDEVVNTYHMFDSTDTKVGSMIFGTAFEDGLLVSRDTSQFDNGSVYETAEFFMDTTNFQMKEVRIDFTTPQGSLDIDFTAQGGKVNGTYNFLRDTLVNSISVDSAFQYNVFRGELYMLLQTLLLEEGDTLEFQAFVPTGMFVSTATLIHAGEESITTFYGQFDCDVVWLKTDGAMPDNKIWISKTAPRKLVKFYVPGAELDIELVGVKRL